MVTEKKEYLTFRLDGETYAISIATVREVVELGRVTALPLSDPALRGLIDLRGAGVPVVDLRAILGLPAAEATREASVLVVDAPDVPGRLLGAIADSVLEVTELGSLEPAPAFGTRTEVEFIAGIARRDGGFVVVLDMHRLFARLSLPEMAAV